jgi:hypothetical protein
MRKRKMSSFPSGEDREIKSCRKIPSSSSRNSPLKVDAGNAPNTSVGAHVSPSAMPSIRNVVLSKSTIYPSNEKEAYKNWNSTRTRTDLLFNFMSAGIACSADEILFVKLVGDRGFQEALRIATKFDLRCLRTLQALLSDQSGCGRGYTKPSVATFRPTSISAAESQNNSSAWAE